MLLHAVTVVPCAYKDGIWLSIAITRVRELGCKYEGQKGTRRGACVSHNTLFAKLNPVDIKGRNVSAFEGVGMPALTLGIHVHAAVEKTQGYKYNRPLNMLFNCCKVGHLNTGSFGDWLPFGASLTLRSFCHFCTGFMFQLWRLPLPCSDSDTFVSSFSNCLHQVTKSIHSPIPIIEFQAVPPDCHLQ